TAARAHRRAPGVRVGVGLGEELTIAAIGEAREPHLPALGALGRRLVDLDAQLQAAQALERVAPPRAVVHALAHGLAVLAVAGDVAAGGLLPAHDVLHGQTQSILIAGLVLRLARLPAAVQLDQLVRPRQAAGVAGEDPLLAALHPVTQP